MKRNSFNVLFFIKKAKLLKNGEASVCMRITPVSLESGKGIRQRQKPQIMRPGCLHRKCENQVTSDFL